MSRETLVYAFHDGKRYEFERADQHSASVFGGPMPAKISGQPLTEAHEPRRGRRYA
jgi:hypothetical protein